MSDKPTSEEIIQQYIDLRHNCIIVEFQGIRLIKPDADGDFEILFVDGDVCIANKYFNRDTAQFIIDFLEDHL